MLIIRKFINFHCIVRYSNMIGMGLYRNFDSLPSYLNIPKF